MVFLAFSMIFHHFPSVSSTFPTCNRKGLAQEEREGVAEAHGALREHLHRLLQRVGVHLAHVQGVDGRLDQPEGSD